jgi:hypothetical protein
MPTLPEGYLLTERFLKKLEEFGYSYRGENKVTKTFKAAGKDTIFVRKSMSVSEGFVKQHLRKLGQTEEAIMLFIATAKL